jgi:iron complex outermembrane recepter protein
MRLLLLTVAGYAVMSEPLPAQRDSTRSAKDSIAIRLPTLTVTGTRSSRRALEQPLAITELGPQDWSGRKGAGLDEALSFVPGVIAQSRTGWTDVRLSIRGFGSRGAGDRSNSGTSRGVRVLLDGFPETEPDGRTSFDLIDFATATGIEVIRSNASALWGNAAGGLVHISTLPTSPEPAAWLEPVFGSFGYRRVTVRAGHMPDGGHLGGSLTWAETDGWREHSEGERLVANVAATTELGRRSRLGLFVTGGYNKYNIPGPLTEEQMEEDPEQANPTYLSRQERRFNRLGRLGMTYETRPSDRHTINASVYVQPKFLQRSERGSFRDFTRYHVGGNLLYHYSSALGERGASVFTIGADEAYQDGAILFYSLTPEGERGEQLTTDKREGANNFGLFVQEEMTLGQRWGLNLGARFDNIHYYAEDFLTTQLSDDKSFQRLSPKIGVTYRLSSDHALYASLGGGVEAPAGNETDPASTFGEDSVYAINPLLDPITSTTYEVGMKQVASPGSAGKWELSYDLAGYYTSVRNEIVPYRGGRFYFTAGKAGRAGVELGGRVRRGGLTLRGGFGWNHHEYLDYVVDSVHYQKPGAFADYSGNQVVGVPDWTWTTGLSWSPAGLAPVSASVTLQGNSSYFADDANTVTVDGFSTVSVSLGLDRPIALGGGGLALSGFVSINNLFDTDYVASAFLNPDYVNGVPVAFEPGLPRNLVFALSLGWIQ